MLPHRLRYLPSLLFSPLTPLSHSPSLSSLLSTPLPPLHFSALHPTIAAPPPPLRQMFVRLFVDENLDRMVPISKQPKEKIQAIIESCSRQFPEFQERSRKRIRTYLKSCRRMKKGGFEVHKRGPTQTPQIPANLSCCLLNVHPTDPDRSDRHPPTSPLPWLRTSSPPPVTVNPVTPPSG